ncbi:MAG TPA: tail fiber protein [Rhodopila sp.]|jgi:microcystin-dependent protein|nr:tail fiber protein [Rhodopila sp.]
MAEPFLGQITVYPYSFPPKGWADCAGQLLMISQYTALYSLLGTTYGGNGTSNFALPDLRGRIPLGQGPAVGGSTYDMGEMGGVESVTLDLTTMASHSHGLSATESTGNSNAPSGQVLARPVGEQRENPPQGQIYNPATPTTPLAPGSIGTAGSSLPHNNIQPSLGLRYCIALQGVFPARS